VFSLVDVLVAIEYFNSGEAIPDTGRVVSLQELLASIGAVTTSTSV